MFLFFRLRLLVSQFEELMIDLNLPHPSKLLPFLLSHHLIHSHWHVTPTLKRRGELRRCQVSEL